MDIIDILQEYGATLIIIILLVVIAAMSKGLGIWDSIWSRVRKHFDAEYAEKEKQKSIEKKTDDAEAFMTAERERLDAQIAELYRANGEVREEMQRTDQRILDELAAIREALDARTRIDDARYASTMREYILHFNMELVRDVKHTREDFVEVLAKMDDYDKYCRSHPDYPNHQAKAAIDNISRVYAERLKLNDFA